MSEEKFDYEEYVQNKFDEAIELTANSQYKEAIDILMQIVEKSEEKVPIYSSLANNYICLSDYDNACQMYDNAINYAEDDYIKDKIILQKANLLFDIGKNREAVECYTQVEDDNSDYSFEVYANKAKCYYELKDYNQSLLYANKYLNEISNDDKDMLTICGTCFYELRQYQDALKIYLKLYVLNKNNVEILKSIVSCSVNIKDYNAAIQYNKELIEYLIIQLNAKKKMLEHSVLKSDTESIHMYQEKIYNLEQELSTEYFNLAKLYDAIDDYTNAKKYYDLSIEYKPQNKIMSEENFNYEEYAQSMYEQALELMPEDIGVGDKEYLAIIIKQYILMSGEAIAHEHYEYDSDTRLFVAQVIAEWTFNKGIEIIRNGVKGESRDALLNTVAFIVWEIIKDAIEKDVSSQEYLDIIENQVKKGLCRQAMNLFCENKISESVAKTFIKNEEEFNNLKKIVEKEIRQREELFLAEYGKEEWVKYYDQRYEELTKQITENPNDAEAYYARGSFQSGYGYVDNNIVLSDYNKAIELNPNYLVAYCSRRYVLEQLEEYEKAKADYEKVIELQPTIENYDLYIRFLNTYIEKGSQIALEVCEKIFESFPVCDKLYELRGSTYYYLKNYDNAIADYKKAIELCPKEDTWRMDDLKMTLKQIEQEKNDSV